MLHFPQNYQLTEEEVTRPSSIALDAEGISLRQSRCSFVNPGNFESGLRFKAFNTFKLVCILFHHFLYYLLIVHNMQ